MHISSTTFVMSLTILPLSLAIPNVPIQRRSYVYDYLSRVTSFRSTFFIAPGCLQADGVTPCPESAECSLGYQIKEHLYVDCKDITICAFNAWEGPDCTKPDNSDEVCQQTEEEIIATVAEAGGWTKEEAAQKLANMWALDGKVSGPSEVCKDKNETTPVVTTPVEETKEDIVVVAPPVKVDPVEETKEETKSEVDSTTTIRVKMTSTVYVKPAEATPTLDSTTDSTKTATEEPEVTKPPRNNGPGYGQNGKNKPRKGGCYWNAGCESFDPVL